MKNLIIGLLALALSVGLTLVVLEDNGYILVGYGHWTVEGSLAFFLLLDLLLFMALYALLRSIVRIWNVPERFQAWRNVRQHRLARRSLTQGLVELSEGRWKPAEKNLIRYASRSDTPLINYLAAARSAQQQGAHDRRDQYLQMAHESMPSAEVAVGLTQAELQLSHKQFEQALATLKHLRQIAPKHTHVLKLLKELYERLGDWQELHQLLPVLKKRKVIKSGELQELELSIYRNLINRAAQSESTTHLMETWKSIPHPVRQREEMVSTYINHMMIRKEYDAVVALMIEAIGRQWSDDLVELYSRVNGSDPAHQLSKAEGWLKERSGNAVLLLALGRLCLRNKLWGKARSYYEASISVGPSVEAYRELGALLERMSETEKAMASFREGLALGGNADMPELPDTLERSTVKIESSESGKTPTDINPPKLGLAES
ncbi:heme biosynthesis HemY N-terminal domain-containing protein [Solemya velesiana gill symbiont]|uniref:Heme biosynthesis protein HemY n=1 Tax=Solemya velesiana gill symbiont TaxID=1918948 RepID=A0A1T2KUP4_9GAMM|nr:heme biosynthesis HemY N-terminal domain-containing protein [Solemya velesiana gill symbiont]OOZ36579.1 heme biosynthesis protein HemY [Solemya velesiana gill symbiont]